MRSLLSTTNSSSIALDAKQQRHSRIAEKRGSWNKTNDSPTIAKGNQTVRRVTQMCTQMLARFEKHAGRERHVIEFYRETVRRQQEQLAEL